MNRKLNSWWYDSVCIRVRSCRIGISISECCRRLINQAKEWRTLLRQAVFVVRNKTGLQIFFVPFRRFWRNQTNKISHADIRSQGRAVCTVVVGTKIFLWIELKETLQYTAHLISDIVIHSAVNYDCRLNLTHYWSSIRRIQCLPKLSSSIVIVIQYSMRSKISYISL